MPPPHNDPPISTPQVSPAPPAHKNSEDPHPDSSLSARKPGPATPRRSSQTRTARTCPPAAKGPAKRETSPNPDKPSSTNSSAHSPPKLAESHSDKSRPYAKRTQTRAPHSRPPSGTRYVHRFRCRAPSATGIVDSASPPSSSPQTEPPRKFGPGNQTHPHTPPPSNRPPGSPAPLLPEKTGSKAASGPPPPTPQSPPDGSCFPASPSSGSAYPAQFPEHAAAPAYPW